MMMPMGLGGVSDLVIGTVFKIAERQNLPLAGSIPVRLRHPCPPAISVSSVALGATNDTGVAR
jgi:hypothetical protein